MAFNRTRNRACPLGNSVCAGAISQFNRVLVNGPQTCSDQLMRTPVPCQLYRVADEFPGHIQLDEPRAKS